MPLPTCPRDDVFEAFLRGALAAEQSAAVESHISECSHCLEALKLRDASGSLQQLTMDPLAASSAQSISARLASLMQRLKITSQIGLTSRSDGTASTLPPTASGSSSTATSWPAASRYQVLRPHAKGALGEVFVAQDCELEREVALKEIQARYADDRRNRERFLVEAKITGGLEHPGIVPVYGIGAHADGRPYYAMKFLRGDNFKTAADQFRLQGPARFTSPEFRQLLRRFVDVCNALAYAHSRGVLHRDLKPGNIMLGSFGETLVVDWGLAKAKGQSDEIISGQLLTAGRTADQTAAGTILGTPAFMSPEQAAGDVASLGPASDIYSLGATLYYLLAGQPPHQGANVEELLQRVQRGEIEWRKDAAAVPLPLRAICERALARLPGERYFTALKLAEDIENWLADEPVIAYREPLLARTRRKLRKRPMVTGSIFASLLVGLIAFGIGWFVVGSKNRELSQTNASLVLARKAADEQRIEAQRQEQIALTQKRAAENNATLATLNAEQAAAEKERLKKALDFFIDAFHKTTPEQDGRELRVADLIISAAKDARLKFAEEPVIEAQLLDALSEILLRLGLVVEAVPLAETALSLREESLGPDDSATLSTMSRLAFLFHAVNQHPKALPLLEDNFRRHLAKHGPDHIETLRSQLKLAQGYSRIKKNDLALDLLEEALPKLTSQLGPDDEDTLMAMSFIAVVYQAVGQPRKALAIQEEMLPKWKARYGADHPTMVGMNINLASTHLELGQRSEGIKLLEEIIPKAKDQLGVDHPNTLAAMRTLAQAYYDSRQFDKSIRLYEEVVPRSQRRLGPDNFDTLSAMKDLADSYLAVRQFDKAVTLYEETLERYRRLLGPNSNTTMETINNLMYAYFEMGQKDKGLALFRELLIFNRTTVRPESWELADVLANGALELFKKKAWAPAEEAVREELALREKLRPSDWKTFAARALLGAILISQGGDLMALDMSAGDKLLAEGEQLILAGRQGLLERKDQIPAANQNWLINSTQWLVRVYTFRKQPAEAAKWQAELEKLKAQTKN